MIQLRPGEQFPISYQIPDPNDVTAYFVQAVVRNAVTNKVLSTVNLAQLTGQQYFATYQIPADTSGQGFYIGIKITVYTDSGFTTPSANYGIQDTVHLVMDRVSPFLMPGGGPSVDYEKISGIINRAQKEPERLPIIESAVKSLARDFSEYQTMISGQLQDIVSGFSESISTLKKQISAIDTSSGPEAVMREVRLLQQKMEQYKNLEKRLDSHSLVLEAQGKNIISAIQAGKDAEDQVKYLIKFNARTIEAFKIEISRMLDDHFSGIDKMVINEHRGGQQEKKTNNSSSIEDLAKKLASLNA